MIDVENNQNCAVQEYEKLTKDNGCHPDTWTSLGCCYFMLGMYPEADKVAQKGRSQLENLNYEEIIIYLEYWFSLSAQSVIL